MRPGRRYCIPLVPFADGAAKRKACEDADRRQRKVSNRRKAQVADAYSAQRNRQRFIRLQTGVPRRTHASGGPAHNDTHAGSGRGWPVSD